MRKNLWLIILCALLSACALTELASAPTSEPTRAPVATQTRPLPGPFPTSPEVVVPTFPPLTPPAAPTSSAPSTAPTTSAFNGDSQVALAQGFDGKAALEYVRYLAS